MKTRSKTITRRLRSAARASRRPWKGRPGIGRPFFAQCAGEKGRSAGDSSNFRNRNALAGCVTRRRRGWLAMCRFYITLNTRVPHASKRSKTTLLPTYECTVRINGPRMLATILSTMPHAPEALEGSTPRPRCHHSEHNMRHARRPQSHTPRSPAPLVRAGRSAAPDLSSGASTTTSEG